MIAKGETDDTRRQITLALMEAAAGRTAPPTALELLRAADVFLGMHDYPTRRDLLPARARRRRT